MGVADVRGMLAQMPAPDFDAWLAAYIVDPWTDLKLDLSMSDDDIIATFRRLAREEKQP